MKKVAGNGKGFEITELWAYIAKDPIDGDEGVTASSSPRTGMVMPLIGADMDRVKALRPHAQQVADQTGVPVKLVRFYKFAEVETIEPRKES